MHKLAMAAALAILLAGPGCSQLQSLSSGHQNQTTPWPSDEAVDFTAAPSGEIGRDAD